METSVITGARAQYDEQVKLLLSRKPFLARILARCVRELEGLSATEVEALIEGEPDVGVVPVAPGLSNLTGGPSEDVLPGEGRVLFDIKTNVLVPGEGGAVRVIVNVEAQKSAYPGYRIETRGVFYAARLISAQLGVEFTHSRYDALKKVYSIWICMDAPASLANTIVSYRMSKEDLLGVVPDEPSAYDKIEVVIVSLNRRAPAADEFTSMMNLVLAPDVPRAEKLRSLEGDYNMELTGEVAEGVNVMCNLSEGIAEEFEARGFEKGIEKGIEKGAEQARFEAALNMLRCGVSREDIAKYLRLSSDELERLAVA